MSNLRLPLKMNMNETKYAYVMATLLHVKVEERVFRFALFNNLCKCNILRDVRRITTHGYESTSISGNAVAEAAWQ